MQEEEKNSTTLVRGGSFRGSHLSVRRAEVLQMLSEGDSKNGLFTLTRRRTVQPVRSNNDHGSQSSLHTTSTKVHATDLSKWGSSDGLQQRSNSMPWLRSSSVVRQGPPSKLQASVKATREGTSRNSSTREGTPRKGSTREGTPQQDITSDRMSSSNSPITPLSTATPTLTTSRSSLGSESQTKITSTTPIPVVPPVKPKPHQEVKKPSPAREVPSRNRNISPLVNGAGGGEPYDEFDDSFTFQRSASMRAEKSSSAFSRSAKIRRSFSKKNSIKNGISRIYFGDSQIARAAMELADEKKPDDQLKREPTPKEDSKSPPPSQSKMTYGQKKRRFASFKGKHQHHDDDYDVVDAELHRSATLPSRPKGSYSKNSMLHAAPPKALNHGEASSASLDEAAIKGKSPHSPPRGPYSSSQLEHSTHSKFSNYTRIEPLHVHNSSWDSDGYGDNTHSTFGTLGRKPQRRRSPAGTTKMATPRMYSSSPMRKNSSTRLSPKITNGHIPNSHSDNVFDLTDPEHTITESEEKYSKVNNDENVEKKRQSELLDQIRVGIELKKERQKEELARKSSSNLPWNVSAILERRLVLRPSIEDDEIPDDWSEDL